ncbi:hypothetical protein F4778DRAFT_572681 [Xylariomycetidae sp. FL2044]|nr:hypothetical protein F4778DRAFT_572681 [Xylariomycetidae sp. FL2044]
MLLTSSQVSVLLSSVIVVACTTALFLSGYVIQQRTLRDLRTAINPNREPRPSPKIYYYETGEDDGVGGGGGGQNSGSSTKFYKLQDGPAVQVPIPAPNKDGEDGFVVVRRSVPAEDEVVVDGAVDEEVGEDVEAVGMPDESAAKPVTSTQNEGEKEESVEEEKPISRAERRRRIKAEIQRLSQGESPVYYQRRLW